MKLLLKVIFIIFTTIIGISCSGSDFVEVKVTYYELEKGEYTETLTLKNDTTKMKFGNELKRSVTKIEGVEKLKQVTALFIGNNVEADISFINQLTDLEILVLYSIRNKLNSEFISNLPNLKILYLDSIKIKKPYNINFINNKKLVFITLNNLNRDSPSNYIKIDIQHVPETLKYFDMWLSGNILKTKELIDNLTSVPYVFLPEKPPKDFAYYGPIPQVDESYFKDKPNFIFKNPKEVLPEEYWLENIFALFDESY